MTDYKDAEMVTLTTNYRSTQTILDSSYKVIKNNNPETLESRLNISKKLASIDDTKTAKPRIVCLETQYDEVEFVMETLKSGGKNIPTLDQMAESLMKEKGI